ncbi:IclR family transcriptional regulator [Alcaligenaceae bacterium]|nr:IclR family transcriptional regulator [Alcaligenaceae bacterium]
MNVKTAARTLDLFEVFAKTNKPLTLSELAHALQIPVSSCFALARTLENRGYVYVLGTRKGMYPTKRLLDVASKIVAHDPILERVQPTLSSLRDITGETIVLSKQQGERVVTLDVYLSSNSIRYDTRVGEFRMLHSSSSGKALLGAMNEDELKKMLAKIKLKRLTDATLTTRKALQADLDLSRERGWYANSSESVADLIGVAATVPLGGEMYALSVVGPVYRMSPQLDAHVRALLNACRTIQEAG